MRSALALILLAAVTGCATPEERIRQAQVELDRTCQGYGFKPGTDGYRQCWMQVDQRNRAGRSTTLCSSMGSGGMVCN